jgi:hypothetical protein
MDRQGQNHHHSKLRREDRASTQEPGPQLEVRAGGEHMAANPSPFPHPAGTTTPPEGEPAEARAEKELAEETGAGMGPQEGETLGAPHLRPFLVTPKV